MTKSSGTGGIDNGGILDPFGIPIDDKKPDAQPLHELTPDEKKNRTKGKKRNGDDVIWKK